MQPGSWRGELSRQEGFEQLWSCPWALGPQEHTQREDHDAFAPLPVALRCTTAICDFYPTTEEKKKILQQVFKISVLMMCWNCGLWNEGARRGISSAARAVLPQPQELSRAGPSLLSVLETTKNISEVQEGNWEGGLSPASISRALLWAPRLRALIRDPGNEGEPPNSTIIGGKG